jgi:c-di-GMP-binding flagellar brake protein YcgR
MTDKANPPVEPEARTASNHLDVEHDDNFSRYLLYSRAEILFVLKALVQKGSMVTVYFDRGNAFLLTSLNHISTDGNTLIFDYGSDEEMNRRALQADKLVFTTTLDKVKIQFSLKGLAQTTFDGRKAFSGKLPETVLRLQRREYYRLTTPIANPIKVSIDVIQADGSKTTLEANMLDISGGGIGVMVPLALGDTFRVDTVFKDCKFTLPEEGPLVTALCVRSAFPVTTKTGSQYLRIGCEYVDLPGTRLTMIQRYITRIERERKAKLSGLE